MVLTGPTGIGQAWKVCALAPLACRTGSSGHYVPPPRLFDESAFGRAEYRYMKLFKAARPNPQMRESAQHARRPLAKSGGS